VVVLIKIWIVDTTSIHGICTYEIRSNPIMLSGRLADTDLSRSCYSLFPTIFPPYRIKVTPMSALEARTWMNLHTRGSPFLQIDGDHHLTVKGNGMPRESNFRFAGLL
jgi:hypothetical protein